MTVLSKQRAGDVSPSRGKRLLDLAIAVPALLIAAPVGMVVAFAIASDSPGGVLFRQKRVGANGTIFTIFKFRTMFVDTPNIATSVMLQLGKSPITPVGRFLRRTSLDEIPQLINIVRGEMSLVGPRPALPSQTYLNKQRAAYGVDKLLPGLTGWAQINGRDELSDDEKIAFDRDYLVRRSLGFDLHILWRTLLPVITGRGNR